MNQLKRDLLERSLAYWLEKSAEITDRTLATFQQEQAILQNIIRDALTEPACHEPAVQLLLTLQPLIERRGIADQWLPLAKQAQNSFASQTASYWHLSVFVGYLHYLQHDWSPSHSQLTSIVTNQQAPLLAQADAAHYLSALHYNKHQLALAETYARQARQRYEQIGSSLPPRKLATTTAQQALIASKQQQKDTAEAYFQTAVQLWKTAKDSNLS